MSRLSGTIRDQMAVALVHHRFREEIARLSIETGALLLAVRDDQYDAETRRQMTALEKRRPKAFNRMDAMHVNVGGRGIDIGRRTIGAIRSSERSGGVAAEVSALSFLHSESGYRTVGYTDGPLAERLTAFADALDTLRGSMEEAYGKARGALNQFVTGKALSANWPEAIPIIGHLIPEDNRQLPTVQVEALNDEFDLPPEVAAA